MSTKAQLTFGSDPEFVLIDQEGRYRSAIGIVRGTKEKKVDLGNGHKMFYDNVLLEMNLATSNSRDQLLANIADALKRAARAIYPHTIRVQASHVYPPRETEHEDAQVFGCEAEYCAYEMAQLNPPVCEPGNTFRSAGGHIHLGYTASEYPLCAPVKGDDRYDRDWGRVWVVRMMDLFVSLPSLLLDHDPTSAARRKLYGRAGTHRPKEQYGVEYRATSNFWYSSQKMAALVYDLSAHAVSFVRNKGHMELWQDEETCKGYDVGHLRRVIDNSDIKTAKDLMESLVKKYLPGNLFSQIFQLTEPAPTNLYREWNINL